MRGHYHKEQSTISIVLSPRAFQHIKGIHKFDNTKVLKQTRTFVECAYLCPAMSWLQMIMALLLLLPRWLSGYWYIHPAVVEAAEKRIVQEMQLCNAAEPTLMISICPAQLKRQLLSVLSWRSQNLFHANWDGFWGKHVLKALIQHILKLYLDIYYLLTKNTCFDPRVNRFILKC